MVFSHIIMLLYSIFLPDFSIHLREFFSLENRAISNKKRKHKNTMHEYTIEALMAVLCWGQYPTY